MTRVITVTLTVGHVARVNTVTITFGSRDTSQQCDLHSRVT